MNDQQGNDRYIQRAVRLDLCSYGENDFRKRNYLNLAQKTRGNNVGIMVNKNLQ